MLTVTAMTREQKVAEGIKRGVHLMPRQIAGQLEALITPASLATMAASLVALVIAQALGVGEIADLFLLAAGLGFCGKGVFDGLRDLTRFVEDATGAKSERDLDVAAGYFAKGAMELGVNAIMTILLKKPIQSFYDMGGFRFRGVDPGLQWVRTPPPPGVAPTVSYRPIADYGQTDAYGNITIDSSLDAKTAKLTLDHEMVHRFFSPKLAPFRAIRARWAMSGYSRAPLLRYIEEALAEGNAQVRAQGLRGVITAVKFPLEGGPYAYVTAEQRNVALGTFLGIVIVDGQMMHVNLFHGSHQDAGGY